MDVEKIVKDITAGLKGNPRDDVQYLMEQCEKYKENENAKEILRAIGRIIHEILPDDVRKNIDKIQDDYISNIKNKLEEVDLHIKNKDTSKALEILEGLVKELKELGWYKDDQVSQYYCFNNPLEEILFKIFFQPKKEIRQMPIHYVIIHFKYGELLLEQEKYKEAKEVFEIAEKFNPMDTRIKFSLAEICRIENDWEKFFSINKNIYECTYTNESLYRYYSNMGFYYMQKSNFDLAIELFALSQLFMQITDTPDQTDNEKIKQYYLIKSQLNMIKHNTGKICIFNITELKRRWRILPIKNFTNKRTEWILEIPDFTDVEALKLNDVKKHFECNGLFFGASEKILTIMSEVGQDAIYKNANVFARNIYNLLFELTNSEHYKNVQKSLPKTDRKRTVNRNAKKATEKKEITKKNGIKKETVKKDKKKKKITDSEKLTVFTKDGKQFFDIIGVKDSLKFTPMEQEVELIIFETSTGMDFVKIKASNTLPGIFAERACGDYLYPGVVKIKQSLVFLKINDIDIPCDLINFKNIETGLEKQIYFDVSSFYGKQL